MAHKLFLLNFFIFTFFFATCNSLEPPPPPPEKVITLTLEDIATSKAWLKLSVVNFTLPASVFLNQNEQLRETINLTNTDTLIYIDALLPKTTYTYEAIAENIKSKKLNVTTMDTTSHSYNWETFTIGEFQSALFDVWGTDENNVYACGTAIINDTAYGILKWNGNEWLPEKKIGGLKAIYGFSNTDIWAVGGGVWHYNGFEWEAYTNQDSVINNNTAYNSCWGTSSNNLYFGSSGGKIINWDGEKASVVYTYVGSGLTSIVDIYGISENYIFAAGINDQPVSDLLLHFNGNNWARDNSLPLFPFKLHTVTSFNINENIIGGSDVYFGSSSNWRATAYPFNTVSKIRGKAGNDLFGVGSYGSVAHYNGEQWKFFDELYTPGGGRNNGVFVSGNKVYIVGWSDDGVSAKILIGTRQ